MYPLTYVILYFIIIVILIMLYFTVILSVFYLLLNLVSHLHNTYFDLFHISWPIVVPTVDHMNMNK